MDPVKIAEYLRISKEACAVGREVLMYYFGRLENIQSKDKAGLVSEADVECEKVIADYLSRATPEFGLLAEENHYNTAEDGKGREGRWILDPLDGTTNYIHRFPIFCISLGLEYQGEMILGAIDVPMLGHLYTAARGLGAFRNDSPIRVSEQKSLSDALVATGFFGEDVEATKAQMGLVHHMLGQTRGLRRPGAAAYDLCMVAEGVFDVFWEKNLSPWDTAAGMVLVEEAGGVVSTYSGDNYHPEKKSIIATNKALQPKVLLEFRQGLPSNYL